ncbi:inorganic diphosphatase [Mesotoga sp. H07.pep.5.3]|jgi:inorganic pyrophosphatase|uniref:inorganic diphosphatase n=3 Tax=Kosmotogaceae TaxID=1643948 RepID=UPI00211E0562|nr:MULTISPECIES: inorganic diphosphatase [Mesotoga]HQN61581.1 inorganic diphosphatase [Mesotoga prima]HUM22859.1 inorganic diphosphatase [Mesotoga prima]
MIIRGCGLSGIIVVEVTALQEEIVLDIMIEIPKGSRNKYEYDKKFQRIRFDRTLFSAVHYPMDYGFILNTLAEDEDPLDAMVLLWEPTFPGCLIEAKPIGAFKMWDEKGPDEKVLCVPIHDPVWNYIETLDDVPPHLLKEIEHFFSVYKDLEKKKTGIEGWVRREETLEIIAASRVRYLEETQDS